MASRTVARTLTFGARGAVSWRGLELDELCRPTFELTHAGRSAPVGLQLLGAHQVVGAAAAAAMALCVGEPLAAIAERLSTVAPGRHRMQPRQREDGLLVIDDSYNANPDAVRAALKTLAEIGGHRAGRTVAVLGEMQELGAAAVAAHREIGSYARGLSIDVVAVGPAGAIARAAGGASVESVSDAVSWLRRHLAPDDVVLVKGSRAAGLERVVASILESS